MKKMTFLLSVISVQSAVPLLVFELFVTSSLKFDYIIVLAAR
jgi:hypothetical protein